MNYPYRHMPTPAPGRRGPPRAFDPRLALALLMAQLLVCGAIQSYVARMLTLPPPPREAFAPTALPMACVETTRWIRAYDRDYACPPGAAIVLYAHEDVQDTWQVICQCRELHGGAP